MNQAAFGGLKGLILTRVEALKRPDYGSDAGPIDEILFVSDSGRTFHLHHVQDCCEDVIVESIVGDLSDLVGSPILLAEEASEQGPTNSHESSTWTFYKLATIKGYVDIRWIGTSNGYYSESVDFEEIK